MAEDYVMIFAWGFKRYDYGYDHSDEDGDDDYYTHKVGLNENNGAFDPDIENTTDGFFFCKRKNIAKMSKICFENGMYFSYITIPTDAKVSEGEYEIKSDKIIIQDFRPLHELGFTLEDCKMNGFVLKHIQEQTPEMCLAAVEQNGEALQFVKEQTPEMCVIAVSKNAHNLHFVKTQTEEICLAAVRSDGYYLYLVNEKTEMICKEAVKSRSYALMFVNQTPEICMFAIRRHGGCALKYVKDQSQTPELCLEAVKQNRGAISYVKPEFKCLFDFD